MLYDEMGLLEFSKNIRVSGKKYIKRRKETVVRVYPRLHLTGYFIFSF